MMAGLRNRLPGRARVMRPTRLGCALRGQCGYTLVELIAALLVLSLMTAMVSTGVSAGARAYERTQFSSQADMLSATVNSALSDAFRFMYEDGDSYVVVLDGEKVAFAQGSSALQVDGEGRFRLVGADVDKPLVNDGVYGACAVSDVTMESCAMSGVKYSYSLTNGGSLTRTYSFTATPLSGVQRDRGVSSGSGAPSGGEGAEPADKTALNAEIARVEAIDLSGGETAPKAALKTALAAAKAVADNEGAAQQEVDEAAAALAAARMAYESSQSGGSGLDLSAVEAAIAKADAAKPWTGGDATAARNLQAAYDAAVNVRDGYGAASQDAVDAAAAALESALQAFVDSISGGDDGGGDSDVLQGVGSPEVGSTLDEAIAAKTSVMNEAWTRENSKWKEWGDSGGESYDAVNLAWDSSNTVCAVAYYDGNYYKAVNANGEDTTTVLLSAVPEGQENWRSAFSVSDLTDGKSRDYGSGAVHWVLIATA